MNWTDYSAARLEAKSLDCSGPGTMSEPWTLLLHGQDYHWSIAYATEAHLFITDMNQSPFNVGARLTLKEFSKEQVTELNCLYSGWGITK